MERHNEIFERLSEGLRLSVASYSGVNSMQQHLSSLGYHTFHHETTWFGAEGFCCIHSRKACIAFCGTDSLIDILVDVVGTVPWYLPPMHSGFAGSWRSLQRKSIGGWLTDHANEFDSIGLYGHSLGGAMAQVAAFDLHRKYEIGEVITFGSPRFGYWTTAYQYDLGASKQSVSVLKDRSWRVVNGLDLVPRVPPRWLGYEHAGQLVYLDSSGKICFDEAATNRQQEEGFLGGILAVVQPFVERWLPWLTWKEPTYTPDASALQAMLQLARVWFDQLVKPVLYFLLVLLLPLATLLLLTWYFATSSMSHLKAGYGTCFTALDIGDALPPEKKAKWYQLLRLLVAAPLLYFALKGYFYLILFAGRFIRSGVISLWQHWFG